MMLRVEVGGRHVAVRRGESDVDRGSLPAGLIHLLPQVIQHPGQVVHGLQRDRAGRLRHHTGGRERVPAVTELGDPAAGALAVAADPDRDAPRHADWR